MTPCVWVSWQDLSLGRSTNQTKSSLECLTMNSNQRYNAVIMCHNVCLFSYLEWCLFKRCKMQRSPHTADRSCYSLHDRKGAVEYQWNAQPHRLIFLLPFPLSSLDVTFSSTSSFIILYVLSLAAFTPVHDNVHAQSIRLTHAPTKVQ